MKGPDPAMHLDPANIPDAIDRPADSPPSRVRQQITRGMVSRRRLFQGVLGAGMVIGLTSLDLLPTGKKAYAAPSTWLYCSDYNHLSNYAAWANTCNANGAGQHVSTGYCDATGYHRQDATQAGCMYYDYVLAFRCLGRNAWVWRKNGVAPEYSNKRCSDGWVRMKNTCTGVSDPQYKSTCLKYL